MPLQLPKMWSMPFTGACQHRSALQVRNKGPLVCLLLLVIDANDSHVRFG